jgi:peptidoglycan/xylan/chitin deacetylase (PgdA/CDA1 family)
VTTGHAGRACVSVDLDGLWCYHEIHGLPPRSESIDPAYDVGVRRLLEFFDALDIPTTLFAIGRDAEHPPHAELLADAAGRGHEIASHSHAHDYALRRRRIHEIREDLRRADRAIEEATGTRPVGFRTPGYNVDTRILGVCAELGYRYDSSVFPCPPYWLAKAAVMGWLAVRGRRSRSSMTRPDTLFTPLQPYRPDATAIGQVDPQSRLPLEIPMCVVPGVRFPIIGTSLHLIGARGFELIAALLRRTHPRLLNLEFHAIDFMDADDPGAAALGGVQPDLSIPWPRKARLYRAIFDIVARDWDFATLADATDRIRSRTPD